MVVLLVAALVLRSGKDSNSSRATGETEPAGVPKEREVEGSTANVEGARFGIALTKAYRDEAEAEAEANRLNDINADKDCLYLVHFARLQE